MSLILIVSMISILASSSSSYVEPSLSDVTVSDEPSLIENTKQMHRLQLSLRSMESYISKQEKRVMSSFIGIRKRMVYINKLTSRTLANFNASPLIDGVFCPSITEPLNGRMFGGKKRVAEDESYFICNEGFRLVGSETRVCLSNSTWSGIRARCQAKTEANPCATLPCLNEGTCINTSPSSFKCDCQSGFMGKLCHKRKEVVVLDPPTSTRMVTENDDADAGVRSLTGGQRLGIPPNCRYTTPYKSECTCPSGYQLSIDKTYCEDIDECSLFDIGHRVPNIDACRYSCQNVPGSFLCSCPPGHQTDDERNKCIDIDECSTGLHKCNHTYECFNVVGSHQCATVKCPPSYVQTHLKLCERPPCHSTDWDCLDKPLTITFNFMTLPLDTRVPSRIFKLTAQSTTRTSKMTFSVLPSDDSGFFSSRRYDAKSAYLYLERKFDAPRSFSVDFHVLEEDRDLIYSSHVARVVIFVSTPLIY